VLVGRARDLDEQIGRVLVVELERSLDGGARRGAVHTEAVGDRGDGVHARDRVRGVLVECRGCGRHSSGAEREPAESGRPLGDRVDVLEHALGDRVVELVQLDEVAALDVPVRLLELRVEIERVGETRVQELDELVARGIGDADPRGEGALRLRGHGDLPAGWVPHRRTRSPARGAARKGRDWAAAQPAPGTKRWIASPTTLIAAIAKQIDVRNAVAIT